MHEHMHVGKVGAHIALFACIAGAARDFQHMCATQYILAHVCMCLGSAVITRLFRSTVFGLY